MNAYRSALAAQLLHVALCVEWNGPGLWQKSQGIPTIGPTASFGAIVFVLLLGLLLSALAIYGGFTRELSNWPSEFWRWAGIVVNAVGVIGFLLALTTFIRRKSHQTSSP